MFSCPNMHKITWMTPDADTTIRLNMLREICESIQAYLVLDQAADCGTDRCLGVTTFGDRLAANKQRSHGIRMERFNLRKLNVEEGKRCIALRSQIGLEHLKVWMLRWKLIVLGKRLQNVSKSETKRM
jgi:hypothetical protein